MKAVFNVITLIASIITIVSAFGLFLTGDSFEYFVIVAISGLVAIDTIALSKINTLYIEFRKLKRA